MEMSVAAIIPLYNGSEFIEEALQSVLQQTEPADEIIVVDDGSTDDGPAKVESLAARHPITLIRKENGGQSAARNVGIRHTKCSHVAFLDQDDAWYDDHLAILKEPYFRPQVRKLSLVYGNLDFVDRQGRMMTHNCLDWVDSEHPKTSLQQCLEKDMFILPSASLLSKSAIEAVGFFDERLSGYEDDDLWVRMFVAGYGNQYVNVAVTRWRIFGSSSSFNARMAKSRMIYFHKQAETFPDDPVLNLMWTRNVISKRFMRIVFDEYVQASRERDLPKLERTWSDVKAIVPKMSPRIQKRMKTYGPIIEALNSGPLAGIARAMARRAIRI